MPTPNTLQPFIDFCNAAAKTNPKIITSQSWADGWEMLRKEENFHVNIFVSPWGLDYEKQFIASMGLQLLNPDYDKGETAIPSEFHMQGVKMETVLAMAQKTLVIKPEEFFEPDLREEFLVVERASTQLGTLRTPPPSASQISSASVAH